jgi:acetyl esterase/lipase
VASAELADVNDLLRSMRFAALTLEEQRATFERGAGAAGPDAIVTEVDADGVPCEWITTPGAGPGRTIVALRGGGYCLGSLASNRRFCALLSDVTSARVLNVGYGSAPEHRFPAALDDVRRAYRFVLGQRVDPATVALAGNSAGGGLALAVLLALRDGGDALPAAAVALSPWTDLAATGASITANAATEVMLDPTGIAATAALYADADQLRHPHVSPLYGDLRGLPPLLLHASGAEILRDDAVRFAARAADAGVDVTLEVVADVPHVWHLLAGLLPEADDALLDVGVWLDRVMPGGRYWPDAAAAVPSAR